MSNAASTNAGSQAIFERPLSLDVAAIKDKLGFFEPAEIRADPATNPELNERAQTYTDQLASLDPQNVRCQDDAKSAVEAMGRELQSQAAHRSQMLKQTITALGQEAGDNSPIATALIDLKNEIERLDPHKFDFSVGWFSRLLARLPGLGMPLKRYFSRFETAQTVLDALVKSLEEGRDQLKRNNLTLREDQRAMREVTRTLEDQITLAQLIDQKLCYKLEQEIPPEELRATFIQEELLFFLRQRVMDLQQQLAVNQQGVLATALVIRNNEELVRGVDRSLDVTVSALNVAVTTALALADQKIVLDKVGALKRTTSDLISGTAERLQSQGAETQAATTMIDMEMLKGAFADINSVLAEISRYRLQALPAMEETILKFDQLTGSAE